MSLNNESEIMNQKNVAVLLTCCCTLNMQPYETVQGDDKVIMLNVSGSILKTPVG